MSQQYLGVAINRQDIIRGESLLINNRTMIKKGHNKTLIGLPVDRNIKDISYYVDNVKQDLIDLGIDEKDIIGNVFSFIC